MRVNFKVMAMALVAAALAPTLARAQTLTNNYWVTATYQAVLGRQPDPAGWVYWTGQLNSNSLTVLQMVGEFLGGSEYCGFFGLSAGCTNPPTNGQFLTELYQNALGRPPDQSGWTYWLGQLASGVTYAQVVYDFIDSTQSEFYSKYGGFCMAFTAGYANPLAYTTAASAVGGVETQVTVTYASPWGTSDLASGQIWFDSAEGCELEWSNSNGNHTITQVANGAGCLLDQANSNIASVPGNPKALAMNLWLTFSEGYVGTHEIWANGVDAEGLTIEEDLGAFVVSQGQDFMISATPSVATIGNPYTSSSPVAVTLTVTSVNGFTGNVTLTPIQGNSTCNTLSFSGEQQSVYVQAGGAATAANWYITNEYYTNCLTGQYGIWSVQGQYGSGNLQINHQSAQVTVSLVAAPAADFNISVGSPSPATLSNYNTITYPVIVTSLNGYSGTVSLSPPALPTCSTQPTACITGNFSSSQAYVSGSGATTVQLTLNSSSGNTPGGSFPVTVTGSVGSVNRSAQFTVSTQVTTVTDTPVQILNNGSPTQLTITVSANSPLLQACSTADPNVTCQVVSSNPQAGTATLSIDATTGAAHGTRVIYLNGIAVVVHAGVYDVVPQVNFGGNSVQAGQTIEITASCNCPDPDDGEYAAAPPDVEVSGPGPGGWADLDFWSQTEIGVVASPPLGTTSGTYSITADFCDGFLPFEAVTQCVVDAGSVDVEQPEPAQFQLALTPPLLNLSTGDTGVVVTTSGTPTQSPYSPVFVSGLQGSNSTSSCSANLSFGPASGPGELNVPISASPAGCGGVYGVYAVANTASTNSITVTVPPQVLIQVLYGEAHDQAANGDSVSEPAVGVSIRNRFGDSVYFNGSTTYQNTITTSQYAGLANAQGIVNGVSPELANAASVFNNTTNVSVANAECFFSPNSSGWSAISAAYQSETTTLPAVSYDPGCFPASIRQFIIKSSIANNVNVPGVPAFIFVQVRNPSAPAVTLIQ